MVWYEEFNLSKNPFTKDPRINADRIIKDETKLNDLLYYTTSESIVIVRGDSNSGKTRFALEILNTYKSNYKVLYIDLAHYNKNIDIEDVLLSNQPLHRRLMKLYPKKVILVIDNAYNFSTSFYHRLQYFYDQDYLLSVVLIYKADTLVEIPGSIMSRVGNKYIDLTPIDKDSAVKIISARLKGKIFNQENLDYIYTKSNSFEDFLKKCERIAIQYTKQSKDTKRKIDIYFIRRMLN